jgi:MFS family permease
MTLLHRLPRWPDIKAAWADEHQRKSLLFIFNGVFINAALILTSGVFLSGYIIYLGGSDFLVGLMNNSLSWTSIVALFSFAIYERMAKRKKFLITLLVISRLLVCGTIFLPLVFGTGGLTLALLSVMMISGNVLWGIFSVGFSVWIMSSFTRETRSEFIFRRTFWLRIAFTLINICMGFVMDWSGKSYLGFLVVYLASLVLSLGDAAILIVLKEPKHLINRDKRVSLRAFFEPFRNGDYRRFMIFIFIFYLSLTISSSFTSLYLVRYLEFDYAFITMVTVIANLFMILCTKIWRHVEVKVGLMRAFRLAGIIAIFEFLIYGFLTRDTYYLLFLAPVFAGIGNSGFNIFAINYRFEMMPEQNRTVYEGWFGALFGLSLLAGPTLGKLIMNGLPELSHALFQYSRFQLLYLISFVVGLLTLLLAFRSRPVPATTHAIEPTNREGPSP